MSFFLQRKWQMIRKLRASGQRRKADSIMRLVLAGLWLDGVLIFSLSMILIQSRT